MMLRPSVLLAALVVLGGFFPAPAFTYREPLHLFSKGTSNQWNARGKNDRITLRMAQGFFDRFLGKQQGQFVKMGSAEDKGQGFGPPAILLAGFPGAHDEVVETLHSNVEATRDLQIADVSHGMLGVTLEQCIEAVRTQAPLETNKKEGVSLGTPVILCSGLGDEAVREIARTLLPYAWNEYGVRCAIAKAVPPAMGKELGSLLREVVGDHENALRSFEERGQ